MKKFLFAAVLSILIAAPAWGQSKAEKKQIKMKEVKEAVDSRDFMISVNGMMPAFGGYKNLTREYDLVVKGDSVYSHMPYFGEAYRAPYGGGEGMVFTGTALDYKFKENKKGLATITFSVRTMEDIYDFSIDISQEGAASVYVNPDAKQSISYVGVVRTASDMPKKRRK